MRPVLCEDGATIAPVYGLTLGDELFRLCRTAQFCLANETPSAETTL